MNAEWFDGRSAKAHPVHVEAELGRIIVRGTINGETIEKTYPANEVVWPERTKVGSRVLRLDDGSSLHAASGTDWNEISQQVGVKQKVVVRWQQSTSLILLSAFLVLALGVVGYIWGVPAVAKVALNFVPEWVDKKIGESFMANLGPRMVEESELDPTKQEEIRRAFDQLIAKSYPNGDAPDFELSFHKSKVGPNAFALPGGYMIMTDQLVELADGNTDMIIGVLAHELGHVAERHSMRMVSQTLLIATVVGIVLGDYGDLVATIPLVLGQTAYSRDFEREADTHSIEMLLAGGKSPSVMAEFFRRMQGFDPTGRTSKKSDSSDKAPDHESDESGGPGIGVLISSHPATEERIKRFENATN